MISLLSASACVRPYPPTNYCKPRSCATYSRFEITRPWRNEAWLQSCQHDIILGCGSAELVHAGSRGRLRALSARGRDKGRARGRAKGRARDRSSLLYRFAFSRDCRVFFISRSVAVDNSCHETKNVDGYLRNDLMHTQQDVCCTLPTFSSSVYSAINVDSKSKF